MSEVRGLSPYAATRTAQSQLNAYEGTNTDAVLLDISTEAITSVNKGVIASFKHPTTANVTDGIEAAVRAILQRACVQTDQIGSLMIGSEHCPYMPWLYALTLQM